MTEMRGNQMYVDGCSIEEMAEVYGTPLTVISRDYIGEKCGAVRRDFLEKYPTTRAAYAGKALLTTGMCKIIDSEGFSLDVVSGGELFTAIKAGFPAERIEFNGNNKSVAEIEMAIEYGVGRIIIDGIDEISLIEEECGRQGKRVSALLRITPGVDSHTHQYITTGNVDSKFGIQLGTVEFQKIFEELLDSDNIDLLGFHYHIGSQMHLNDSYVMATKVLMGLVEQVKREYGFVTEEVNIGGGFGIRYTEEDDEKPYGYFLDPVMEIIGSAFEDLGMEMPAVVIEPGRSIVGNAGMTVYSIGTRKNIPGVRKYVAVDGGMTDNIRPALYGSKYECEVIKRTEGGSDKELVTICGKCCESGDILIRDVEVNRPERGDLLVVFGTGAYCYSMASNYNKIPMMPIVLFENGKHRLMVRRQTFEDMLSRECSD